jgi:uncharacterized membrane protein HdeD (DUF308 family)
MSTSRASVVEVDDTMVHDLARSWGLVLVWGLLTIGFGIALLVWPDSTLTVIALLLGIWLLIAGVLQLVAAFAPGLGGAVRTLFIISALLSLVIGVILVKNIVSSDLSSERSLALMSLLIGAAWLINGVGDLFSGLTHRDLEGRGWTIFSGVVGIIAAIIVLAWPLKSLAVLAAVGGILLIVIGVVRVGAAFALRSARSA